MFSSERKNTHTISFYASSCTVLTSDILYTVYASSGTGHSKNKQFFFEISLTISEFNIILFCMVHNSQNIIYFKAVRTSAYCYRISDFSVLFYGVYIYDLLNRSVWKPVKPFATTLNNINIRPKKKWLEKLLSQIQSH